MRAIQLILPLAALLLVLAILPSTAQGATYDYTIQHIKSNTGPEEIFIRAPANGSHLAVNSTIVISVIPWNFSMTYLTAWGQQKVLQPNTLQDFTLLVSKQDDSIYFATSTAVFFQMRYLIIQDDYTLPVDPNWQKFVQEEQEKQRKKLEDAEAAPTAWIFAPLLAIALGVGVSILAGSFGFITTRATKLISLFTPINLIWTAICTLLFMANIVYWAIQMNNANTKEQLEAGAYFFVRLVALFAGFVVFLLGFLGARLSLNRHNFWIVNEKDKRIIEKPGVVYPIDGKPKWAEQKWRFVLQRWRGIHLDIKKINDSGPTREDWVLVSDMDNIGFQPANEVWLDEANRCLKVDSTAETKLYLFDPENPAKFKVFKNNVSLFAHMMKCNGKFPTQASWVSHCNCYERLLQFAFVMWHENLELITNSKVAMNEAIREFWKVLGEANLGIRYGKKQLEAMRAKAQAERNAAMQAQQPAPAATQVQDGNPQPPATIATTPLAGGEIEGGERGWQDGRYKDMRNPIIERSSPRGAGGKESKAPGDT